VRRIEDACGVLTDGLEPREAPKYYERKLVRRQLLSAMVRRHFLSDGPSELFGVIFQTDPTERTISGALFLPAALRQSHTRSAAVFGNELDAGLFHGAN